MSTRYIPELDGLRAIAALVVVAFHTRVPGVPGGFLGVDVFFVLSGYLTASIALSGRFTFREFMARRLRRLWPLLLFVSSVVAACLAAFGRLGALDVLPGAVFLGNLAAAWAPRPIVMNHAWSLGAELQFYAVAAALALWLDRRAFRAACLALFAILTFARVALALGGDWPGAYYGLPHCSGLFLGAILATAPAGCVRSPGAMLAISAATLGAAMIAADFVSFGALVVWIAVAEIASAGMILSIIAGSGRVAAPLRLAPIRGLGVLSYGIYLWHYPISLAVPDSMSPIVEFAIVLGASVLLAAASFRLIEAPISAGARVGAGRSSLPPDSA